MKEKYANLVINGIKTDYIVSSKGKIFTKNGTDEKHTRINPSGYLDTNIRIDNKNKTILVHRAIFESFKGPIPFGMQINHIDGNKLNNNIKNLELVTPRENVIHAWKHGLCTPQVREGELNPNYRGGEYNPNAKHTAKEAIAVYNLLKNSKLSHRAIARMLDVEIPFVDDIAMGMWANVTGYKREDVRRNYKFTEEEELGIWYMYQKGYRTKDICKLTGIDKNCINNKLTYLRRNREDEMNKLVMEPKNIEMVKKFLSNLLESFNAKDKPKRD